MICPEGTIADPEPLMFRAVLLLQHFRFFRQSRRADHVGIGIDRHSDFAAGW
jgi:hypothetical protein